MKKILFGAILLLFVSLGNRLMAQTTLTSSQAGPWTTPATWGGTAPGTASLSNNVVINHSVSLGSNLSLSGSNPLTITINSGGTLTITLSSFTIQGNSSTKTLTIIVKSGGTLNINGGGTNTFQSYSYLTLQSGATMSAAGTTDFINDGYLSVQSGVTSVSFATLQIDYNGTGGATATATVASGATISASTLGIGNNNKAILNNAGTINVSGSADSYGVIINSGTLSVNGNFTQENSSNSTTNSGTFNVGGNVSALGLIQLDPGASSSSTMTINGSLTVNSNPWMIVGTNVSTCSTAITNYANLIVKTDVILSGSGDVTVNQNGRFVVFGNVSTSGSSGGTLFTINCGAQAYVNGNINFGTGGGNTVANNNSASSPTGSNGSPIIGLYVNGSTTSQNINGTEGTKAQLQSNDLTFYNYIAGLTGSPLPVTLLFFKVGTVSTNFIELEWATSTEVNFDHFVLERSADGKTYETLTTVQGHGTTKDRHDYQYTDNFPLAGISYYRLKSVDFDGYTEIFSSVAARNEAEKVVHVYPIPVENAQLNVFFNYELASDATLSILDLSGQEVQRTILKSGESIYHVDCTAKEGVYLLKIASDKASLLQRIAVK